MLVENALQLRNRRFFIRARYRIVDLPLVRRLERLAKIAQRRFDLSHLLR
jgi:hypothetical protein